ncbi:hypothetical protein LP032_098 [Listeria phage LP-032]|uniref:Uncharacterized protein n=5 Tax=Homburgvirus TaxID=1921125 RepID=W0GAA3_9CAUD|nr:hypothetical protein P70_0088 [Listeria phage P70]YP_008240396.2 hypothetical protein LP110_032 [Listeria phage LP-110]YP_008997835.1 hypothetical protein LP037_114 [Listeria phage LP-037]YP_009044152.1 hypothetical protein LP026_067 [Listeria phage LP-026]AHL18947.1 hypothetical protein LP032_098 [Listeria phage LP-032]AFQ96277.1 hypothetical protein P70_0088 [Listeria phage P70]AGI11535.2 hypothetical protein LP110_032 [Listeria phage LP-110]AHF54328.1 hypothetical protein LP037_114 [Li
MLELSIFLIMVCTGQYLLMTAIDTSHPLNIFACKAISFLAIAFLALGIVATLYL